MVPSGYESPRSSVLRNFYKPKYWRRSRKGSFYGVPEDDDSGDASGVGATSDGEAHPDDQLSTVVLRPRDTTSNASHCAPKSPKLKSARPARRKYDPRRYVGRTATSVYASMGSPPRGYLWLWLGHFKRWHRRFFMLTTPGVMVYSRRPDLKGGKWTINLSNASVVVGRGNARQFCLVTNLGVVYLRTMGREDRGLWVNCLQKSIEVYGEMLAKTRGVLQGGDIQPPPTYIDSTGTLSLDVDREQKKFQRELRLRLQSKLSEIRPWRAEVERQLGFIRDRMWETQAVLGHPGAPLEQRSRAINATPFPSHLLPMSSSISSQMDGPEIQAVSENPTTSGNQGLDSSFSAQGTTGPPQPPTLWSAYQAMISSVETVVRDEIIRGLEIEAENNALRRLLREQHGDPGSQPVTEKPSPGEFSGEATRSGIEKGVMELEDMCYLTASETYSTAGSEFNDSEADLLGVDGDGDVDYDDSGREDSSSRESPTQAGLDDELIEALEVVRQVEYASKGMRGVDVTSHEAPADSEEGEGDGDEESAGREDSDITSGGSSPTLHVRSRLPCPRPLRRGFSLWSILKNAIGRDLTRITMPATINEPLSALQRAAEEFEYVHLLERASGCANAQERLLYVTAFALSSYNSGLLRDNKPFNPLLGETYEWQSDSMRMLTEQVSHHPPVSVMHAEDLHGEVFTVQGEIELRFKFWGKSLNVFPTGRIELRLHKTGEVFVWNKSTISIHNIILGRLWLDFHGDITVHNVTNGDCAKVKMLKCNGALTSRGMVKGKVLKSTGEEVYAVSGNFTETLYAQDVGGDRDQFEIFRCNEPPEDMDEQYNMTSFAIGLNDPQSTVLKELPATDSRLRPDVRALENGEFDLATEEKLRLEDKQRHARRARNERGARYEPVWFKQRDPADRELVKVVEQGGALAWEFTEQYWGDRERKQWPECPDIY